MPLLCKEIIFILYSFIHSSSWSHLSPLHHVTRCYVKTGIYDDNHRHCLSVADCSDVSTCKVIYDILLLLDSWILESLLTWCVSYSWYHIITSLLLSWYHYIIFISFFLPFLDELPEKATFQYQYIQNPRIKSVNNFSNTNSLKYLLRENKWYTIWFVNLKYLWSFSSYLH